MCYFLRFKGFEPELLTVKVSVFISLCCIYVPNLLFKSFLSPLCSPQALLNLLYLTPSTPLPHPTMKGHFHFQPLSNLPRHHAFISFEIYVYFQMRRSHIFFATLYKQSNGLINLAFLGLILLILEVFAHFTDLSIFCFCCLLLVFFISKSAISRILVMHSSPTIV